MNSSVRKWPDKNTVVIALGDWVSARRLMHPELKRVGYFGSYARGDWGVGSDLDVVMIVDDSTIPFELRAPNWPTELLPVPVDLLVYTQAEWSTLSTNPTGFFRDLLGEVVWV